MRKVLVSTVLTTLLVLPQAAPVLAHDTHEDAVSLQIGGQEQQPSDGPRVGVSDDGVVVSLSSQDDDDRGLLEEILGVSNDDDSDADDGLLDIFDYDGEEDEDRRGLFSVFGYDEEDDDDRDGLLGDIL